MTPPPNPHGIGLRAGRGFSAGLVALLLSAACAGTPVQGTESSANAYGLPSAWKDAANLLFTEAEASLQTAEGSPRQVAFARAVQLLASQPKTRENIQRAQETFETLRRQDSGDPIGIAATYYLARTLQVHAFQPDLQAAETLYRELFAAHPESLYGQIALVKFAILRIYADVDATERTRRLQELESLGQSLSLPFAVRDFHNVLGGACMRFHLSDEKALEHYIIAEAGGYRRYRARADATIVVAELARKLGRTQMAIAYYRKFVAEFPRDERNQTAVRRLEELTKS